MKIHRSLLLSVLSSVVFSAAEVSGATLALWSFTGQPGNQASTPVTTEDSLITATGITAGSGVTLSAAGNSMSASGWSTGALDTNDYFAFSITIDLGATATLDSIAFAERRSATGIRDFQIRSSLDGFAAPITGTTTNVADDTTTRNQLFTLPSSFANLTGTVEFRIYGYTSEAAGGTWRLANHNTEGGLAIIGTAIPEPAAALLGSIGLLGLLRRRRSN